MGGVLGNNFVEGPVKKVGSRVVGLNGSATLAIDSKCHGVSNGGKVTVTSGGKPPRHGFPPKKHDSAQSMARSSSSSGSDEDVKDSARGSPEMSPDEEPDSPEPDYDTADEAPSDVDEGVRTSVDDDGTGTRRGDSVPAEWLAANTGGV